MAMSGICEKSIETGKISENDSAVCGEWNEMAIATLLDSYTSKYLEQQRGNLKQKDWQDVIAKLKSVCGEGYNYTRCRNKLDSLKKMFKIVKDKKMMSGGRAQPKWKWYDKMEKLMDRPHSITQGIPGGIASGEKLGPSMIEDMDGVAVSDEEDLNSDGNEMMAESNQAPMNQIPSGGLDLRDDGLIRDLPFCSHIGNPISKLGGATPDRKGSCVPGVSEKVMKKRRKLPALSAGRHAKEMASMIIEALEKMETKRLEIEERRMEMLKELEIRRNETHLQIAKLIVESNMHINARPYNFQSQFNFPTQQGGLGPEQSS